MFRMLRKSDYEWVNSQMLKSAFGGQLAVYCNRHGDTACMHFMKDYKCVRNFYCSVAEYDRCTKGGSVIEMRDDFKNSIRVRPAGFHNFNSYFNADDLLAAGVLVDEINKMRENK